MSGAPSAPALRVILLFAAGGFASITTQRMTDAMLPELARVYSTTLADVARVVSYSAIAYGMMQIVLGVLGDRFGKFRVITVSVCAGALTSLGCAFAQTLDQLVFMRTLAGCAAAGVIPLAMGWLSDRVPYAQRQVTLARLGTGTTLGLAGGQLIGGLFVDTLGWRWAFGALAGLYLAVAVLLIREARVLAPDARGDQAGLLARLVMVLRSRWSAIVLLMAMGESAAIFSVLALTPSYLHAELGLTLTAAGGAVAMFGLGALSYTLVARRLIPLLGEAGLSIGGGVLMCAALLLLANAASGWMAGASCMGAGFGFYMLHNTLQTNATQLAPAARGTAVSLFATLIFFGQAGGVTLGAWMVGQLGPRSVIYGAAGITVTLAATFALACWHRHRRVGGGPGQG